MTSVSDEVREGSQIERMALAELTADLVASHDDFSGELAEAAAAATSLALDPANANADEQLGAALRFVRLTLDHMTEEECELFPAAVACGVPKARVLRLLREHDRLRAHAARLAPRLRASLDDEAALWLVRYIHAFEQHVLREEWMLTHTESAS